MPADADQATIEKESTTRPCKGASSKQFNYQITDLNKVDKFRLLASFVWERLYMKNKSIALFAPNLFGGGAERIISILASDFSKQGFSVDLLLGKAIGSYLKDIPSTVNIIDFDCVNVMSTLPHLIKYLREQKPDVLFSSQMHSSTMALWAVKISGVHTNVIIRQPTMLQPAFKKNSLSSKLRQKLLLWSAKRWSHMVVATSQVMADEFISLSRVSPDRVVVIYNPLPVADIRQKSVEPLDHHWFKEGQPPVVLAVGRLVPVKDFQTLIKAFALVRKEVDARLVILGEGPLRADLEQLVKGLNLDSYVQMPGFTENPFQYMKRSKVFVLSSLWEGFPNGMIEAMACSANIVATNCDGGAAEILEHGKWGRLVGVRNSEELSGGIIDVLKSTDLPETTRRAEHFAVGEVIGRYIKAFEI